MNVYVVPFVSGDMTTENVFAETTLDIPPGDAVTTKSRMESPGDTLGADHETVAAPSPGVAKAKAADAAVGVTAADRVDAGPFPAALCAKTVNV